QQEIPFEASTDAVEAENRQDRRAYNTDKTVDRITIDDTERGGISERDRLGLSIDEENHPIHQSHRQLGTEGYAASLVENIGSGQALVDRYRQLRTSDNPNDNAIADALERLPRVAG